MRDHLAWMDGELVLKKVPFRQVVQKLERWYDLEISLEFGEKGFPDGHLNARFSENQNLSEVLKVVTTAFKTTYERHGQEVTIQPVQ
jgi:ferric-dicitrate binding protein FerR (iron transport regulator)